ncbi:retrovirus-related pol polyprotein from transposon TNT 1-94 [Tanacetum coccineum]
MEKCNTVSTPMATTKLDADLRDTPLDQTKYRSMIGRLMYLTASRPDIAYATFELIAYVDADHAGCNNDCKSTSGGIQFLRDKLVNWSSKKKDCTTMSSVEAEYSIPCSPECKIVGQILLDHSLSYALAVTADVPLPVETPENPFVTLANIHTFEAFMNRVGYQGVVAKKKEAIQYPRFIKLIIADMMKKFPNILKRLEEDYHSIKDDVLLTKKRKQAVRESSSPRRIIKKKKQPTPSILPPGDDRERDAIGTATLLSLAIHKTALIAKAQENVAKVHAKLDEEEIDKLVEGNADEESYASAFVDSMFNDEADDVDDTGSKIEPRSQKENQEHVSDNDENEQKDNKETEKENEEVGNEQNIVVTKVVEIKKETNVDAEKTNNVVKEKEVADVSEELPVNVSPTTAATSKTSSTSKHKKRSFTSKTGNLPGSIAGMCWQSVAKTNEMIKTEMSRLVKLAVDKDREVSLVDISDKAKPQDQAADPEIWENLKAKFEQP